MATNKINTDIVKQIIIEHTMPKINIIITMRHTPKCIVAHPSGSTITMIYQVFII